LRDVENDVNRARPWLRDHDLGQERREISARVSRGRLPEDFTALHLDWSARSIFQ
jgi:hypothetical protein